MVPMHSSPKAPKPLVPTSAMYAEAVAAAPTAPMASTVPAMVGIGAIILKTQLGLRVIKLRPTGGASASGKVRVGDIILEVEGERCSGSLTVAA